MSPRTIVITGGAGGLGLVAARHLVQAGTNVILVGRDAVRTAAAADGLRDLAPVGIDAVPTRAYAADLSRWAQVRDLAAKLADDGIRVDVLVNNAGAAFPRYGQTPDGVERTYALNHHAPFLLTHSLLATGTFTTDARIINLSTFVEKRGRLDTTDPDVSGTSWRDRFYSQIHVYATSKLLGLLATRELARRLPDGLRIYSANPGMVKNTSMNTNAGGLMRLTAPLFRPLSITPDQGVRTTLWLATASPAPQPSGGFFTKSQPATPSRLAQDTALARTVYERTAALLGTEVLTTGR
ncbi:SDR family NAD(P)-dependent oxidoreductase [Streptomyces sp. 4503]|uniref:SDR family NAD(P)-dependent oxidoreductase n=1 Tax=Streptomyces niphimycinicus TaxID=2842201 RepID=A0ABS6CPJ3_9ACTN|nr:SDR family NAD(P)-dependent oxidoreductase [Streptomyces niphimycinicus]MBU3868842.1 SDR family NAD(P)-dependent oxidoreductase [Streptomyces niphimycinicus]